MSSFKFLFILVFFCACSSSKHAPLEYNFVTYDNIKTHITYLADDKMEGRRAGTAGEKMAREYIANQFAGIRLTPKGTDGYYQAFDIPEGRVINPGTILMINNTKLVAGKDFFPMAYSPNKTVKGLPAIAVQETDLPWFIDLKDVLDENKQNPHFDLADYIYNNAKKVNDKGASALFLFNSSDTDDKLVFTAGDKSAKIGIPVIYINKSVAKKYFMDASATLDIELTTDLGEKFRKGHNVVGYIDNGARNTIVLGAHFDHLGYGEDGNSMHRTGEPMIHNGADDNASGTAALIELARNIKARNNKGEAKGNNYLFIAFSGEELGLFGSKYFTEHATVDAGSINYMINMDMVGRLNDSTRSITIGGYGTSPEWANAVTSASFIKTTGRQPLTIKIDSSGTGPSDHYSFYKKDIPVLFYFTGLHSDYHKPTDDADKVNLGGIAMVVDHVYRVITNLDGKAKLPFLKTREVQMSTKTSFKVTL